MDAGSVDVDLAPVVAVAIGNEDRVAVVGRVIPVAFDLATRQDSPALQEPTMFRRNDRGEPYAIAIWSHRHLLDKPELRVVVREPHVANRTGNQNGKEPLVTLTNLPLPVGEIQASNVPSRSERNAVRLPSGEIAASISSPEKSVSRCTTTPSSGFVQK